MPTIRGNTFPSIPAANRLTPGTDAAESNTAAAVTPPAPANVSRFEVNLPVSNRALTGEVAVSRAATLRIPDGEVPMAGRHALSGQLDGRSYQATLDIQPDGTYELKQSFADGASQIEAGQLRFDNRTLVLESASGARRAFRRDDTSSKVRLVHESPGARDEWFPPTKRESLWDIGVRGSKAGSVAHYLFADNLGTLDDTPGQRVLRSKEPSPNDLRALVDKEGIRTVLSLNGALDKDAFVNETSAEGTSTAHEVNLKNFLEEELKLAHPTFSLSAGRVPTDQELVGIFKVLLDPSNKPLLLHCRGGSDRTGIISALYQMEFLGVPKAQAMDEMRQHLWVSNEDTWILGAYLQLYKPGTLTELLKKNGVELPERFTFPR